MSSVRHNERGNLLIAVLFVTFFIAAVGAIGSYLYIQRFSNKPVPSPTPAGTNLFPTAQPATQAAILQTASPSATPITNVFNFQFKYGIGAKNILDTYNNKFTKDLIADPAVTTTLILTTEEKEKIRAKMADIAFFSYPDNFETTIKPGSTASQVNPYNSYYFKVTDNEKVKEINWQNGGLSGNIDDRSIKLKELTDLIISIIESHAEYKSLPVARGAYQ